MRFFREPRPFELWADSEDWEIEPWDDKTWRRFPALLILAAALWMWLR